MAHSVQILGARWKLKAIKTGIYKNRSSAGTRNDKISNRPTGSGTRGPHTYGTRGKRHLADQQNKNAKRKQQRQHGRDRKRLTAGRPHSTAKKTTPPTTTPANRVHHYQNQNASLLEKIFSAFFETFPLVALPASFRALPVYPLPPSCYCSSLGLTVAPFCSFCDSITLTRRFNEFASYSSP